MESSLERTFLKFSADKLEQLSSRIVSCLDRLSDEQVWTRGTENENAIGNLVLHLCGNIRQWVGHGAGGLENIRARDEEFAARNAAGVAELRSRLESTVSEASAIIRGLVPERLGAMVTIQKYEVTMLEAIYHAVEHFSQHTGQILFATKLMTGSDLGFYGHLRGQTAHSETVP